MHTDKMLRVVTLHNRTQWMQALGEQEILCRQIVETLGMAPGHVDLIDLRRPTLSSPARGITRNLAAFPPGRMASSFIRGAGEEGPWASVNRTPVGAGLPAIQRTTAFNPARARNRTTPSPSRGEGRGEGAVHPAPARMPARPASGDNT